jgi:hypothetical protein
MMVLIVIADRLPISHLARNQIISKNLPSIRYGTANLQIYQRFRDSFNHPSLPDEDGGDLPTVSGHHLAIFQGLQVHLRVQMPPTSARSRTMTMARSQ